MNKIVLGIIAALIVAAPAAIDKFSIAAKADAATRQIGPGARPAEAAEPGCRIATTRMRGLDGSILVRSSQVCG